MYENQIIACCRILVGGKEHSVRVLMIVLKGNCWYFFAKIIVDGFDENE